MTELERRFLQAKEDGSIPDDTSWSDFRFMRDDDGYYLRPDGVRWMTPDRHLIVKLPPRFAAGSLKR